MALRLKELRESRGIKQSELAKYLNVASNTISTWENNQREPNLETVIKMANFFNVSTDYLLGKSGAETELPLLTKEEASLLRNYRRLKGKAQAALMTVANQMASAL